VRLQRIDNVYLPETFLRQLPHMPPARGSVTLRISDLQPQQQQTDSILQPALTGDPPAVSTLKRITADEAIRNAELYVGVRDTIGTYRVNGEQPLRLRDSNQGRRLILGADDNISIIPATQDLLLERLTQVRRQLRES
jgi:hypothetical protein